MSIVIGLIVLAGVIYYFTIGRSTANLNDDPRQQQIARMLIASVELPSGSHQAELDIMSFMARQGWSKSELKWRITHAVSITKISSTTSVYALTRAAGLRIHNTFEIAH
jgi:hypothetical protein